MISKPLYQNPLAGGFLKPGSGLPLTLESADPNNLMPGTSPPTGGTLNGVSTISNANFNVAPPGSVQPMTYEDAVGLNANKAVKSPEMMKAIAEAMKKGPTKLDPQADMPDVLGPQLIDPGAEAQKKADEEFLKTADEYQKGFRQSEFYKPGAAMTADVAEFIYKSPTGEDITMKGSSSGIGQFGKYLDSIGKGDLLQSVGGSFSSDLLGKVNPNDPFDLGSAKIGFNPIVSGNEYELASEQGIGQDVFGNNPMEIPVPSTPNPVQGMGLDGQPFETTGQYLTGPNEPNNILETLKKIEQGIAGLGGNFGQGNNMNQSSNYGDFDNFGIGSFFPPYGGMYG